jgi:hypothetical protein
VSRSVPAARSAAIASSVHRSCTRRTSPSTGRGPPDPGVRRHRRQQAQRLRRAESVQAALEDGVVVNLLGEGGEAVQQLARPRSFEGERPCPPDHDGDRPSRAH